MFDIRTGYRFMHRIAVCTLAIVLMAMQAAFAQYTIVDKEAVLGQIARTSIDSTLSRLYGVLGWELRFSNQQEAVRLADEMIRLSSPAKNYIRLAEAYRIKGFVKVINQDLQGCLDMYAMGIENAKKAGSHYYLASFYLLTGGMYQDKGDYDMGIQFYRDGLKEAEESDNPEMIAYAANTTAEMYADAGRSIEFILPFYQKALDQVDKTQNWQFAGMTWSNMAKDYLAAGKKKEAAHAVTQSITCLLKKPERAYVYATVTTDIGEVLTGLGRYAEAELYLLRAGVILDSLRMADNRLITLSALAKLYVKSGQMRKANEAGQTLLGLAQAYHAKLYMRDAYKILSDVAKYEGRALEALQHYEQYKNWNDSVFNENKERSIANTEARLAINQKARENDILKKSNTRLQNSNLLAFIAAGILFIAGIFLIVAYRVAYRKNAELKKQKAVIESQDAEKDILLREIHHRVKNNLQIVSGLLNLQAGAINDEKAKEALMLSQKRVKAISLIHQHLYGYDKLAAIPIADYIQQLFADLRLLYNSGKINMYCTTLPEKLALDIETAVPLGLILNEVITNALKYAFKDRETGNIYVDCVLEENQTYLIRIEDDGVGMPENLDPKLSSSLGFRLMRELSRQLHGNFSYESRRGTVITIQFPAIPPRKKQQ